MPMIERTVVVLPMPLRPEQRHDLAAPHLELDAEQHLALAIARLERLNLEHRPVLAEIGLAHVRDRCGSPRPLPEAMMRPATSTEMRSASENTTSMSCSMSSMLYWPLSRARSCQHRLRFLDAEPRHRLVEQEEARLGRKRHGELELAVLAMRHAGGDGAGARCRGRARQAAAAPDGAAARSARPRARSGNCAARSPGPRARRCPAR